MVGKMPNLLIIGAMKCGTSSLHDYLSLHPDIFMSTPKEIHYYRDHLYNRYSLDWYKNFFITNKKIIGTSPQSYTKFHHKDYQHIPERIKKNSPDIKMIYIVRDPIKRYTSHVYENLFGDTKKSIKYNQESEHYLKTGLYYLQISEYLKYFKREQIYILSLEDLIENKLAELNKIFEFLEVDKLTDETIFDFVSNNAELKSLPSIIKKNILYRAGNKLLPKFTNSFATYLFKNYFSHKLKKPTLSLFEENELKEKMKDDMAKFRELTEKSFSKWSV